MRVFLVAMVFLALAVSSAPAQDHAGWSRAELMSKAAELLGQQTLDTKPLSKPPQDLFLLDPTEEASCFLGPDDQAEYFRAGDFATVVMISDQKTVHTLWFYFPAVNVSDPDKASTFYSGFFYYLFPEWKGAKTWALDSLIAAWDATAKAFKDPMISYNDMIARATVNGAVLATAGVPPDIVVYRITTRTQCEHISDMMLAKPRPRGKPPG